MEKEQIQENGYLFKDHCEALLKVFLKGKPGEFYNIGSNKNLNNLQITKELIKFQKIKLKLEKRSILYSLMIALGMI